MERKLRAYLVYECHEGWCIEPTKMEADYSKDRPDRTRSYSRLSQLLFHLGRRINKQDKERKDADRLSQQHAPLASAGASAFPQDSGTQAQPSAARAGDGKATERT